MVKYREEIFIFTLYVYWTGSYVKECLIMSVCVLVSVCVGV